MTLYACFDELLNEFNVLHDCRKDVSTIPQWYQPLTNVRSPLKKDKNNYNVLILLGKKICRNENKTCYYNQCGL